MDVFQQRVWTPVDVGVSRPSRFTVCHISANQCEVCGLIHANFHGTQASEIDAQALSGADLQGRQTPARRNEISRIDLAAILSKRIRQ
jgi:hypothetical protein